MKTSVTIINHKGQRYLVDILPLKRRREILIEKYNTLTKGCDEYNINPYPSKNWKVLPREVECSQELKDMKTLAQYTGVLKLDVYPKGTFYGMKPKEYDGIIIRLEYRYVW